MNNEHGNDNFKKILSYVDKARNDLVEEVRKLLKMPSISGSGEGIEDTASYLKQWIEERLGGKAVLLKYGGHPIVYGKVGKGSRKVIIYNMYDVQPVEPLDQWISPPFEAKIVDDKIIARGAYNTKGALMSTLLGLEAYQKIFGDIPLDVRIVLEGEEELGSPSMPKFIDDKGEELRGAELAYFAIPSERIPGKPTIILGNKGIVFIELKCRVSRYDVHSSFSRGLYNPAAVLSYIASHLINPHEGPRIPWLEDKAITPTTEDLKYIDDLKEALPREDLMELYGIYRTRLSDNDWYLGVFFKPTVNIDGFTSGYTGPGTKTITPAEAVMRLDFRLVPNIEPEDAINGVKELIKRLGLEDLVEVNVLDSYTWSKTDPRSRYVDVSKEVYRDMGLKPYIIPMLPGSAPSYLFTRRLGVPMIATAPGHGGRAHAPNEYITIDTVPKIVTYTASLINKLALI